MPFDNNSFDYILSIASFQHLVNNDESIKALNEMYRILIPSSKILLSVW